jgi:glycosyltransferase involved in cell wall biosynthesis
VITTPESNLPAILAIDCGLVVRGDDVDALSSALSTMVVDHGLRERMSDAGKRLVAQHYTWGKIAECALQLYGQCGSISTVNDTDRLSTARTG